MFALSGEELQQNILVTLKSIVVNRFVRAIVDLLEALSVNGAKRLEGVGRVSLLFANSVEANQGRFDRRAARRELLFPLDFELATSRIHESERSNDDRQEQSLCYQGYQND